MSLGDKLTVIFKGGKTKSFVNKADLVRSLDSCMSEDAKPTTAKPGNPLVKVASTSMTFALTPSSVAAVKVLTIFFSLGFCLTLTCFILGGVPLYDFGMYVVVVGFYLYVPFYGCPIRCPLCMDY